MSRDGHGPGAGVRIMPRMEIIRGLHNLRPRHRGCVATIGNFDGVHKGHQQLLAQLNASRDALGVPSVLVTFEPLPREFFRGAAMPARLTRFREKVTLLEETGLDRVLCLPFDEQLAAMPARDIVDELLVAKLGVKYLLVGDDFRFGHGREGDYAMLEAAGKQRGFDVGRLGTLSVEGGRVSSTRVREALADGDLVLAEKLLGHAYFIMGRVIYGRRLGRQLGTPTANIQLQRYQAALNGVFAVEVDGLARRYAGVANIGIRPTVDGREPLLEVHLFDFAGDLYGRLLTVTFRRKIREEQTFESLDALKAQIRRDVVAAQTWLAADGQ